jgi:hypothetical protein
MPYLFPVTWEFYEDSTFANLLFTLSGVLPMAETWDGELIDGEQLTYNFNIFTDHLENQAEFAFLGSMYTNSDQITAPEHYLPASRCLNQEVPSRTYGVRAIFSNGCYLEMPRYAYSHYSSEDISLHLSDGSLVLTKSLTNGLRNCFGPLKVVAFTYGGRDYYPTDSKGAKGILIKSPTEMGVAFIGYVRPYYNIPYGFIVGTTSDFCDVVNAIISVVPNAYNQDPYDPGGSSGPGGGGGTFDDGSDIIGLPPLPTVSFASTGFTRIYNPTLSELNALANYLWTDTTFLQTVINHLKQLLENPMDAIISLSLVPCPVPNGSPIPVKVMYIDTGVTMAPATTQFVDVDCGTLAVPEYYGSALDYNPYTKIHCYLPYIGQVTLDTDEVMGRTLQVVYRIDIVTGMCAAIILVDQNVLYQFSGHCAINMPINSADFSGYIGAAMTAGKMVAGVVAGATGNLPLAAELIGGAAAHSSTTETFEKTTVRNPATGRQVTSGTNTKIAVHKSPGASFGELTRKAVSNTVGSVMGSKLTVEHAGGFTGNSGYLAVRRPYLIIERPRMCNPAEYGKYNGRPSMIYTNLGSCSGYTEVQSIQLNGIPATNPELSELSELLKSGVIL